MEFRLNWPLILEEFRFALGSGGCDGADGSCGAWMEAAEGAGTAWGKLPDVIHRFSADGLGGVDGAGAVSGGPAPRRRRGWELLRRFTAAPAAHAGR